MWIFPDRRLVVAVGQAGGRPRDPYAPGWFQRVLERQAERAPVHGHEDAGGPEIPVDPDRLLRIDV